MIIKRMEQFFRMEYFLPLRLDGLIIEFSKMNAQIKSKNFVGKLEYLLQNPSYQKIITWSEEKTVIEVLDSSKMQKEILPFYFRHQKFESFVRQLNLYGFKKLKCSQKQRFTHHLLQTGSKIFEITSCKNAKSNNSNNNQKTDPLLEKTLSETCPVPSANIQKMAGSAFTIYNPLSENRRNIFIPENGLYNGQPNPSKFMVFPSHQYIVWNWIQSFNRSYVGNILLSQSPLKQQQIEIAQQ